MDIHRKNSGFTLIELLVVMAIIAILAGIILPSLALAKKSSQRQNCISNLKQLGLAVEMYHQGYSGYLPDAKTDLLAFSTAGEPTIKTLLLPFVNENDRIFYCMSDVNAGKPGNTEVTSYRWNYTKSGEKLVKFDRKDVSNVFVMLDGEEWHRKSPGGLNMLFLDGHVTFCSDTEYNKLVAEASAE